MPRLIVIRGADEGKQYELDGPAISVGRDANNHIRLHDTEVSRRHAEFRRTDSGYMLCDLGSANGCFVNSQPVKQSLLHSGDQIQIGQTVFVFSAARVGGEGTSDLADRISMITRQDMELPSAIVKSISQAEGSRILAQPQQAGTAWLQNALANLAVMYEVIHTVSHIIDLDQLLERIMDLTFRSIAADRGCIMLRDPDSGQFEPKAVRWRTTVGAHERMAISRTIMDYVLRNKQGILVSDAARDSRFNTGQSILLFGIREALCVPMTGRHETLGVLYLDTHTPLKDLPPDVEPTPKFHEDHLKLAIAIAHQAALAVEDTRYHQAMVQAERLAAIGQAIAALSHHIKNILQGLRSGSDVLKLGLKEKDDVLVQKGWRIVEKNQGKIYDLVMDMLSYSKDREPALESTDFNRVVRDVLELLQGRITECGIQVGLELSEHISDIPADPEGLHRAVLNILTNAIDALENRENPRITVRTELEADGDWVRIVIEDNGAGIPFSKQAEVFRPFVSTKGARGTGLGLAVSRKIMREHGGDIVLQSQPGQGSRFILRLPTKSPLSSENQATGTGFPALPPPLD